MPRLTPRSAPATVAPHHGRRVGFRGSGSADMAADDIPGSCKVDAAPFRLPAPASTETRPARYPFAMRSWARIVLFALVLAPGAPVADCTAPAAAAAASIAAADMPACCCGESDESCCAMP